ncbi:MAG: hypothetical protein JWQ72_3836 [Polaromonas sp.]|nr:hypothetical protein [Polaromonas sp.]
MLQVFGIWPDNVHAFSVYRRLHNSQWRVGPGGLIGLDYSSLPFFLELEGVTRAEWPEVTSGVQLMECEAVYLHRQRSRK